MSRFGNLEFDEGPRNVGEAKPRLKDADYYLQEAEAAFRRGLFEPALRAYSKVIEHSPTSPAGWSGQIRMLIELREFKEASIWADKALEKFPTEPEILGAKASALARLGEHSAALAFSDASISHEGDAAYLWLARGDVLLARKESRAQHCFERALALTPGDWVTRWMASRIFAFYEQFARAVKLAQEGLSLDGGQAALWMQLGHCQLALGLVEPSEHSFTQARELDPQCGEAARQLRKVAQITLFARLRSRLRGLFSS